MGMTNLHLVGGLRSSHHQAGKLLPRKCYQQRICTEPSQHVTLEMLPFISWCSRTSSRCRLCIMLLFATLTTFCSLLPVRLVCGTLQTNESSSDNNDDYNMINSSEGGSYRQFHSWKKEAKRYARDVLEGSRNPFNKFDKDPTLDRIRKDSRLEHLPQSKTNKCSSSSKKKKSLKGKKVTPKKKKKERKESTRCALCVGLFGSSNAKKLCIFAQHVECTCNKMRGNSKATCF